MEEQGGTEEEQHRNTEEQKSCRGGPADEQGGLAEEQRRNSGRGQAYIVQLPRVAMCGLIG